MHPECRTVRKTLLDASRASGHGHIPSCFSVVESLFAVYRTMRHDPARPDWAGRDIFILSKGHASLALYAVLAHFGYFPVDELSSFGTHGSRLGAHVDRRKVPGVEVSTGSLGHGIGLAVGMALAFRLRASARRVVVLVGDGEANEGSVWESIMIANNLGLANLTIVYDNNGSQQRSLQIPNPAERLRAFGCHVLDVDGHDVAALEGALRQPVDGIKAIVAATVKGYGCRTLAENVYEWHRRSPNPAELARLMDELDAQTV
jgi:transketolase